MRKSITILEVSNGFYVCTGGYDYRGPVDSKSIFVFTDATDLASWMAEHFAKPDPSPQAQFPYPPQPPLMPDTD